MKILLVTFSDNADHQDTIFGMYEELSAKQMADAYLMAIKSPKVPLKTSDHTWLVDCPKRPGIEKKTFDIITLGRIIERIKSVHFDAVYFESLHVWNVAIMIVLGRKIQTFQVIHEVIPHDGDQQVKGVDFMNKVVCKLAGKVVLRNKKYVNNLINSYHIDSSRVKYLELWRRYPEFTKPVHSGRVLFFGRINPYKGADNLLEIVRLCPDIHFDVIGRVDSQMENIANKLREEKNVNMCNEYVSDDAMKDAFVGCDWVIIPYNSASQSGIIIDAYRFSRPVIAFDVGAISEQIEPQKSGFLVETGENKKFADVVRMACKMPNDQYDAMCAYAYKYGCEKYASSGATERFMELIGGQEKR